MNYSNIIFCANPNCSVRCGAGQVATFRDPEEADLQPNVVLDEQDGDVYCSQKCYDESHPIYCVDCGDEQVEKSGDRCAYCTIVAKQGEEAANVWYRAQHPEVFRKPVVSVHAPAPGTVRRLRVV